MENIIASNLRTREHRMHATAGRCICWGLVGGLVGTTVMDVVLMGALTVAGLPGLICFSIVGETVARFFSIPIIQPASFVLLGASTHYLVGPVIGAIFGAIIAQVGVLKVNTPKKAIVLAVLFVEILSQPILMMTPILLPMTASETMQWFGGAFVMHFILAIILGTVVGYGLRLHTVPIHK